MEEKARVCCFTGHRPENMGLAAADEESREYRRLKKAIRREICAKIDAGVSTFITGCARGADIICGEIVVAIQRKYPHVKLACALPFIGQEERWSQAWKARHENLLSHANAIVYVCDSYSRAAFLQRDRYMVDHSTDMIAVFNGADTGGTAYTVKCALQKALSCVLIHPETLNTVRREGFADQIKMEL